MMKVKVLKIRISEQFQNMDEAAVNEYLDHYAIISMTSQLIVDDINYWSVFILHEAKKGKKSSGRKNINSEDGLLPDQMILYHQLKNWRAEKAQLLKLPPYLILHNAHLLSIAKYNPSTLQDLVYVNGLGKAKIEKFGAEIIDVLQNT